MVSLALILMTLPSRVAEVRAGGADRARHGESATTRAVQGRLPDDRQRSSTAVRLGRQVRAGLASGSSRSLASSGINNQEG